MKCNYCNYEVSEECICCPNCGENPRTKKKNKIKEQIEKETKETKKVTPLPTSASLCVLWGLISFFIPLVGLILFCMWIKSKPKEAKAAGIGALARVAIYTFYLGLGLLVRFISSR